MSQDSPAVYDSTLGLETAWAIFARQRNTNTDAQDGHRAVAACHSMSLPTATPSLPYIERENQGTPAPSSSTGPFAADANRLTLLLPLIHYLFLGATFTGSLSTARTDDPEIRKLDYHRVIVACSKFF